MKLCKLILLRLKLYFKNPTLILSFTLFSMALWLLLSVTKISSDDVLVLPISIIDLDQSEYSQLIMEGVSKKQTVYPVDLSQEEALKQVSTGKLEAVYILKEGLMDHILEGNLQGIIEIVKSPVSLSAGIIGELFSAEVIRLSSNVDAANSVVSSYGPPGLDTRALWQEAWEFTDAYWEPAPLLTIHYQSHPHYRTSPENLQATSYFKKNILKILIGSLFVFSIVISNGILLKEKNNGTLKRILSTVTPLWVYLLSNILSVVIIHVMGLFIIYTFITFI